MQPTLIRPGLLVSLKTTLRGGVTYQKTELEADHAPEDGSAARVARWETTRQIEDAAEHEAAGVARGKARTAVTRICCPSSFGLLCPAANEEKLQEAIEAAQAIAAAHNSTAKSTRLDVFVITGRIADNDEQAARAIGAEVRELIAAMETGVRKADPAAIREAASKARALSGMLGNEAQRKISAAIIEVRTIASEIVQRVGKAGETAASVVDGLQLSALEGARFAVLDMMGEGEQPTGDLFAAPGRAVDLEPAQDAEPAAAPAAPAIELEG